MRSGTLISQYLGMSPLAALPTRTALTSPPCVLLLRKMRPGTPCAPPAAAAEPPLFFGEFLLDSTCAAAGAACLPLLSPASPRARCWHMPVAAGILRWAAEILRWKSAWMDRLRSAAPSKSSAATAAAVSLRTFSSRSRSKRATSRAIWSRKSSTRVSAHVRSAILSSESELAPTTSALCAAPAAPVPAV